MSCLCTIGVMRHYFFKNSLLLLAATLLFSQSARSEVTLIPDSVTWDESGEIAVPLRVTNFDGISGVQFTLEWDASVLDLVTQVNASTSVTEVKVTTLQGVMTSFTHPQFGVVEYLEPFFEGKHFNYPLTDLNSGDEISGKATFLWSEQDQPSLGRTVDDDDALFTIYFTVSDLSLIHI